jgi:hypothetical protein
MFAPSTTSLGGRARGQILVDDVLAGGRDEDLRVGRERSGRVERAAVLQDAGVTELAAQRHEPGYVDPVLVDDGAGRRRDSGDDGAQLDEPFGRGPAHCAEALDGHPRPRDGKGDGCGGRIGRLGHAVPGHAELVVGQTTERTRESDGCAAVTELVDEDGRVVLGQAHVESEDVLGRDLVGERPRERPQHRFLVRRVGVTDDPGLRTALEQVHGGPCRRRGLSCR